jgi:exodeoxyribonuclease VII large subunit
VSPLRTTVGGVSLFDDDGFSDVPTDHAEHAFVQSLGIDTDADARPATWSVGQLADWIERLIDQAFPDEIWVEGEIANLSRSHAGHVYFSLIEPGSDQRSADHSLSVTLFDRNRQRVNTHLRRAGGNVRMEDGVRVRIRGQVQLYGARSQIQLRMVAIDPSFTIGDLEARRRQILESLTAEGLLGANARLTLPLLPLRVGLVTSIGSAAHADFVHELELSGIGFEVVTVDARVQGSGAEGTISSAIRQLAEIEVDVVAIVRGGGARTDLAAFDSETIARSIAACPVPVVCGIGHEIDRTITDEVVHTSFKTPTACADALVERVRDGQREAEFAWIAIVRLAQEALTRDQRELTRLSHDVSARALTRLDLTHERLARLGDRVESSSVRLVERAAADLNAAAGDLSRRSSVIFELATNRVDSAAAQVRAYDPSHALARGWSLTRRAGGGLIKSVDDVAAGDELITQVADGTIDSVAAHPRSST